MCRSRRWRGLARTISLRRGSVEAGEYPRMHVFLATSDLHLQAKLHMTREQALEAIGSMSSWRGNLVAEVEFSAEMPGARK